MFDATDLFDEELNCNIKFGLPSGIGPVGIPDDCNACIVFMVICVADIPGNDPANAKSGNGISG